MTKATTTSKKAPTKRRTTAAKVTTKRNASKKASAKPQSFKLIKETQPFTSFKITEQTVYWLIFTGVILFFGLWILNINIQVQELYDQIDQNQVSQIEIDARYNKLQEAKSVEN